MIKRIGPFIAKASGRYRTAYEQGFPVLTLCPSVKTAYDLRKVLQFTLVVASHTRGSQGQWHTLRRARYFSIRNERPDYQIRVQHDDGRQVFLEPALSQALLAPYAAGARFLWLEIDKEVSDTEYRRIAGKY